MAGWRSRIWPRPTPTALRRMTIDPAVGLTEFQARELAFGLGLKGGPDRADGDDPARPATAPTATLTPRWWRSTRWSSPARATSWRLMPRCRFDTNALFRRPQVAELRDRSQEDPREMHRRRPWPRLCRPRRRHRLHHQRRGPRDGDDGHDQAGGRRACQLPRHRRRRQPRARGRGLPHRAGRPATSASILVNIFAGHQPLRLGRRRGRAGLPAKLA